jgi:hypothetical protein
MNWRLLAISRESFSLVRGKNVRIRNSRGRSAGRRRAGGLQQRLQPARSRGDAARYFDPQEVESIARVVEDVWKNAPAASKAQAQSLVSTISIPRPSFLRRSANLPRGERPPAARNRRPRATAGEHRHTLLPTRPVSAAVHRERACSGLPADRVFCSGRRFDR